MAYDFRNRIVNFSAAFITAFSLIVGSSATAASITTEAELKSRIGSIKAHYEPRLAALSEDANELKKDLPSKEELIVNISNDMEPVEFKLHIPEFVMKLQTWKLHIPEVTMKLQKWRFHLPEPGMKYVKFSWGGGMHIPSIVMKEHVWKLHIPEVTMKLQTWKLHIPEVTMKLQKWRFHLPKISIGGPRDEVNDRKAKGAAIQTKAQALANEMKSEVVSATREYMTYLKGDIAQRFDKALSVIDHGITNAPTDEVRRDLTEKRSQIAQARVDALAKLDANLAQLG